MRIEQIEAAIHDGREQRVRRVQVVDTNVLVSRLLTGVHTESALALHAREGDWRSEAFVLTALANVLAAQVRLEARPLADGSGELARGTAVMLPARSTGRMKTHARSRHPIPA